MGWFVVFYIIPVVLCWGSIYGMGLFGMYQTDFGELARAGGKRLVTFSTLVPFINIISASILTVDLLITMFKFRRF